MATFPNELLEKFLQSFGRLDVLSARLVCSSWNSEIKKMLKSSSFKIHLAQDHSFEEYIAFDSKDKLGLTLPFHLTFYANDPATSLDKLEKFDKNVDSLLQMFGQECVKGLKFQLKMDTPSTFIARLITLLNKLSSGLKNLEILSFDDDDLSESFVKNWQNDSSSLPQVEELRMTTHNYPNGFWRGLIEKCPNAQKLSKFMLMGKKDEPIPEFAMGNPILHVISFASDSLSIRQIGNRQVIIGFKDFTLDVLWEILHESDRIRDEQFLVANSATLENLTIVGIPAEYLNDKNILIPFIFTLTSTFANLTTLAIRYIMDAPQCKDLQFDINPNLLPVLTSVEFPHYADLKTQFEFPTVTTLILSVENPKPATSERYHYKNNVETFQRVFPNVNRVRILKGFPFQVTANRGFDKGGRAVKDVLQGLIDSEGASEKILEIELVGCPQNYLGEVFHQLSPDQMKVSANNLTNVRKFTIGIDQESFKNLSEQNNDSGDSASEKIELYVDNLVANFPFLREINISNLLLGKDLQTKRQHVRAITSAHPGLKLNVC